MTKILAEVGQKISSWKVMSDFYTFIHDLLNQMELGDYW